MNLRNPDDFVLEMGDWETTDISWELHDLIGEVILTRESRFRYPRTSELLDHLRSYKRRKE